MKNVRAQLQFLLIHLIVYLLKAVCKMEKPQNVTATLVDDDVITVSWQEPIYHPPEFFYMIRVSHYPHTSHVDVWVPRNTTSYDVNVTKHAGQNFTFLVKSATQEWSSEFSDPVTIQTSKYCGLS